MGDINTRHGTPTSTPQSTPCSPPPRDERRGHRESLELVVEEISDELCLRNPGREIWLASKPTEITRWQCGYNLNADNMRREPKPTRTPPNACVKHQRPSTKGDTKKETSPAPSRKRQPSTAKDYMNETSPSTDAKGQASTAKDQNRKTYLFIQQREGQFSSEVYPLSGGYTRPGFLQWWRMTKQLCGWQLVLRLKSAQWQSWEN